MKNYKILLALAAYVAIMPELGYGYANCKALALTIGARCDYVYTGVIRTDSAYDPECRTSMGPACGWRDCAVGCTCASGTSTDCCSAKNDMPAEWTFTVRGTANTYVAASNTGSTSCTSPNLAWVCQGGYYGETYGGPDTCPACPDSGSSAGPVEGTNFAYNSVDNRDITKCYIPANETRTDETGTYEFEQDCYYSN